MSVTVIIIWTATAFLAAGFFIHIGRIMERFENERRNAMDAAAKFIADGEAEDQSDNVVSFPGRARTIFRGGP